MATAVLTVGTFVPLGQYVYGFLPQTTDPNLVYGSAVICIGAAFGIHLLGHWVLGDLE